jgi:ubiquinone/menaquinone biosynthesis C-methylase UbiE
MLKPNLKAAIRASFSAHASTYDSVSSVHRMVAQSLIDRIACEKNGIPDGPILEIGCGTGHLSILLQEKFPDRHLTLVDISEQMIEQCRRRLSNNLPGDQAVLPTYKHRHSCRSPLISVPRVYSDRCGAGEDARAPSEEPLEPSPGAPAFLPASDIPQSNSTNQQQVLFLAADAEHLSAEAQVKNATFALIASSFTFQWFSDFQSSIQRLTELLRPGGALYFAFPVRGTFKEWRRAAIKAELPFTANSFPTRVDLASISRASRCRLDFEEVILIDRFPDSSAFFTALKELGAAARTGSRNVQRTDGSWTLRRLMRLWDTESTNRIEAHYHVALGKLSK